MTYEDLLKRAADISNKFDQLNIAQGGTRWSEQDVMAGFVGDVGDLSKIIMAKHGVRAMDDVDQKLAHELSDCLWSVLVLASKYQIDLAGEFMKTMDHLENKIAKKID